MYEVIISKDGSTRLLIGGKLHATCPKSDKATVTAFKETAIAENGGYAVRFER